MPFFHSCLLSRTNRPKNIRKRIGEFSADSSFRRPHLSFQFRLQVIESARVERARALLRKGAEVGQMMKVVGEEGTSLADFTDYLKSEFLDAVYLQQNAFSEVDAATPEDRQRVMFDVVEKALFTDYKFDGDDEARKKDAARKFFLSLQQAFIDWNNVPAADAAFTADRDALLEKIDSAAKA